jgi:hypothetical protein
MAPLNINSSIKSFLERQTRNRAAPMGKRSGILDVLCGHVGGPGQHMALPVHGLRERRRRLPHPLHHHPDRDRSPFVLHGDDAGPVLEPRQRALLQVAFALPER